MACCAGCAVRCLAPCSHRLWRGSAHVWALPRVLQWDPPPLPIPLSFPLTRRQPLSRVDFPPPCNSSLRQSSSTDATLPPPGSWRGGARLTRWAVPLLATLPAAGRVRTPNARCVPAQNAFGNKYTLLARGTPARSPRHKHTHTQIKTHPLHADTRTSSRRTPRGEDGREGKGGTSILGW